MIPIIKQGTRILRPTEYTKIVNEAQKGHGGIDNKVNLNTLLFTGLRYVEALRLRDHPEWVSGGFIHLPDWADKKVMRRQRGREIKLTPRAVDTLEHYFTVRRLPGTWGGFTKNLARWAKNAGLDPKGMSVKTTRKTWESWLIKSYPTRVYEVMYSQGHSGRVSLEHYQGFAFDEHELIEMRQYIEGW